MHKRKLLLGLLVLLVLPVFSPQYVFSDTYTLRDYPLLENGYSLSGEITTNGATGVLSDGDITSWSFTISLGNTPQYSQDNSNGNPPGITGNVYADSSSLYIQPPRIGISSMLRFTPLVVGGGWDSLNYSISDQDYLYLQGADPQSVYWSTTVQNVGSEFIIADNESQVPEPSLRISILGMCLLGIGGVLCHQIG